MSPARRRRPPASPEQRRHAPRRDFWGAEELVEERPPPIRRSEHPTALVESLGAPPFPRGEIAHHYFELVYERAATLAMALATAAGLAELDDLG